MDGILHTPSAAVAPEVPGLMVTSNASPIGEVQRCRIKLLDAGHVDHTARAYDSGFCYSTLPNSLRRASSVKKVHK